MGNLDAEAAKAAGVCLSHGNFSCLVCSKEHEPSKSITASELIEQPKFLWEAFNFSDGYPSEEDIENSMKAFLVDRGIFLQEDIDDDMVDISVRREDIVSNPEESDPDALHHDVTLSINVSSQFVGFHEGFYDKKPSDNEIDIHMNFSYVGDDAPRFEGGSVSVF